MRAEAVSRVNLTELTNKILEKYRRRQEQNQGFCMSFCFPTRSQEYPSTQRAYINLSLLSVTEEIKESDFIDAIKSIEHNSPMLKIIREAFLEQHTHLEHHKYSLETYLLENRYDKRQWENPLQLSLATNKGFEPQGDYEKIHTQTYEATVAECFVRELLYRARNPSDLETQNLRYHDAQSLNYGDIFKYFNAAPEPQSTASTSAISM